MLVSLAGRTRDGGFVHGALLAPKSMHAGVMSEWLRMTWVRYASPRISRCICKCALLVLGPLQDREVEDYSYDLVVVTELLVLEERKRVKVSFEISGSVSSLRRERFIVPIRASGCSALLDMPDELDFGVSPVKFESPKTIMAGAPGICTCSDETGCLLLASGPERGRKGHQVPAEGRPLKPMWTVWTDS